MRHLFDIGDIAMMVFITATFDNGAVCVGGKQAGLRERGGVVRKGKATALSSPSWGW